MAPALDANNENRRATLLPNSEHKDSLATKSCSAVKGIPPNQARGHTAIDLASLKN